MDLKSFNDSLPDASHQAAESKVNDVKADAAKTSNPIANALKDKTSDLVNDAGNKIKERFVNTAIDTVCDAGSSIIMGVAGILCDVFFKGHRGGRYNDSNSRYSSSYSDYYRSDRGRDNYSSQRYSTGTIEPRDISFISWSAADDVLTLLGESMDRYGSVSVNAFYEAANRSQMINTSGEHRGWNDLNDFHIISQDGFYYIDCPRPYSI